MTSYHAVASEADLSEDEMTSTVRRSGHRLIFYRGGSGGGGTGSSSDGAKPVFDFLTSGTSAASEDEVENFNMTSIHSVRRSHATSGEEGKQFHRTFCTFL